LHREVVPVSLKLKRSSSRKCGDRSDRRFFAAEVLIALIDIDPSRVTPMWLVQNSDATAQNPLPSENTTGFEKLLYEGKNNLSPYVRPAFCRYASARCGRSDH
jgi:hypothetical protein